MVGFTTYREGSMESVISNIKKKVEQNRIIKKEIKLPENFINGDMTIFKREGMKFYIHFSYLPDDHQKVLPVAMWIYSNAAEDKTKIICNRAARQMERLALEVGIPVRLVDRAVEKANEDEPFNKLARMVSLNLRHNVPREKILVALSNIEDDHISTLLTAVRKILSETVEDGTEMKGIKCPQCKSENIVMQSGCSTCNDCKFSGCG